MKADLWRRAMKRYVLPGLPGAWAVTGQIAYQEPVEWLLRGLLVQTSSHSSDFWVVAFVRFLPKPFPALAADLGRELGHGTGGGWWAAPTTIGAAEPVMAEVAELVRAEALPYLSGFATLDTFAEELDREADRRPGDTHLAEQAAYVAFLRGGPELLRPAAERALHLVGRETRSWAVAIGERVAAVAAAAERDQDEATELLRGYARRTRAQFKLPV